MESLPVQHDSIKVHILDSHFVISVVFLNFFPVWVAVENSSDSEFSISTLETIYRVSPLIWLR